MSPQAQLRAEFVNPFLRSVYELVTQMLGASVERGEPGLSDGSKSVDHVMAVVGFTGPIKGSAGLSMTESTGNAMVGRLVGMEVDDLETLVDGMAELVNMVAGSAKTDLSRAAGEPLKLSLPVVIHGEDYEVDMPSNAPWLDVPFTSDLGEFVLRICFDKT